MLYNVGLVSAYSKVDQLYVYICPLFFSVSFTFRFPSGWVYKESACNAGDPSSIPGLEKSTGEGNGYPFQYSCLGNLIDRGTCWTTVYGVPRVRHDLAVKPPPIYVTTEHWVEFPVLYYRISLVNYFIPSIDSIYMSMHAFLLSHFSRVPLFVTLWTVGHQAPLSMGFSRKEYWSELPCPPPGESLWPRDRICVSCNSCISGWFFTTEPLGKPTYVNPNLPIHPSPLLAFVSIHLFSMSISISALQIRPSITFFWIPHICVNIYLFFSFWLHSMWQSFSPPMSLQMAQFHFFL